MKGYKPSNGETNVMWHEMLAQDYYDEEYILSEYEIWKNNTQSNHTFVS
jgi:hypothetical protein